MIFRGGTGTLSEVGLTWEMANFEFGHHEPLIFMGEEWREIVETMVKDLNLDKHEKTVYEIVNSPEEVLELLKNRKGKRKVGILEKLFKKIKNY